MPKILVTRRTFPLAATALRDSGADVVIWENSDSPSQEDLIKAVADVNGLYAHITNQVNAEVMDAAPNLKVIAEFGVGYDNIDIKAANERGIAVCNTPGILS
ncbi:MAG: D-glycerate dehydrogenase, partial [Lentimicrobiaceae bacterium]|nr:D-glycerate dehydrogenase [Lentimicrobiaceae bacterium]